MTDSNEIVPAPAQDEPEEKPSSARAKWEKMLTDLEQERDELRVRFHLARQEARDELEKLDERIAELRVRARAARGEAGEAMDDIGDAAKDLWGEIREGFARVRKSLSD